MEANCETIKLSDSINKLTMAETPEISKRNKDGLMSKDNSASKKIGAIKLPINK